MLTLNRKEANTQKISLVVKREDFLSPFPSLAGLKWSFWMSLLQAWTPLHVDISGSCSKPIRMIELSSLQLTSWMRQII